MANENRGLPTLDTAVPHPTTMHAAASPIVEPAAQMNNYAPSLGKDSESDMSEKPPASEDPERFASHMDHSVTGFTPSVDWTPEEEKKLVWRADLVLMPILILGFFVLQLDRSNIASALTDGFMRDVGITQAQLNNGNSIMYAAIVIFEIPSNLVLYRVGPAVWIGFQMFAWGLIATFQAFIHGQGYSAWMATRFLLGMFECGYIPAGLYTITRFYTTSETSKRFAIFFLGNMVANASGPLIAYGILPMRGTLGLAGWQWLFIIEGSITLAIALAFIVTFPRSTEMPVSLVGFRYFSEHEATILTERVLLDDPTKIHRHTKVTWAEFFSVLRNWRLLGHILNIMASLASMASLFTFAPAIVSTYGYDRLTANAMVSIGYWILIPISLFWGFAADRWGKRGPMVLIGVLIGFSFTIANRETATSTNYDLRFALLVLIIGFSFCWHPIQGSWMSTNCKTAGERSITMAIFVMATNCAGIIGSQVFQERDAPLYQQAWNTCTILACLGLFGAIITFTQYWALNKYHASGKRFTWPAPMAKAGRAIGNLPGIRSMPKAPESDKDFVYSL
jgi:MFS family permease